MKKKMKKVIAYSLLVGIMQFGISASVLEASPRNAQGQDQRQSQHNHWQDQKRDQEIRAQLRHERQENERLYRENLEYERHMREMQRREYENEQDWNDRCWRENEYHNQIIAQIARDVVLLLLDD